MEYIHTTYYSIDIFYGYNTHLRYRPRLLFLVSAFPSCRKTSWATRTLLLIWTPISQPWEEERSGRCLYWWTTAKVGCPPHLYTQSIHNWFLYAHLSVFNCVHYCTFLKLLTLYIYVDLCYICGGVFLHCPNCFQECSNPDISVDLFKVTVRSIWRGNVSMVTYPLKLRGKTR